MPASDLPPERILEQQRLNSACAVTAQFTTTHWSVVLAAGQRESPESAKALEVLCRSYWYPLYAFVRRRGYEVHEAQDLTQEFFARLLGKDSLRAVDRTKGKFRSFLFAALEHFLANEHCRHSRGRRARGPALLLDGLHCRGKPGRIGARQTASRQACRGIPEGGL